MRLFLKILFVFVISLGISCSGDESEDITEPTVDPTAVTLNFPLNNAECHEGTIISESLSEVVFKWTVTSDNNSYTLSLKNLDNGAIKNYNTIEDELAISILRGVPYSWSVISKVSGNSKTAESSVWKFYNAGLPNESHPPFPAEAISPVMGSAINSGTITLQWEGSDVDGDISSYQVLLDEANPPVTEVGNTSSNSLEVTVTSEKIYYWKVMTNDAVGNTSDSEIFQFKVN